MTAQSIAQQQEPLDFHRADREYVQIKVDVGTLEHSVFVPLWFADSEQISCRVEGGDVGRLIRGILDYKKNVDDRLGNQPGHRR
jgi:hypothetical protein